MEFCRLRAQLHQVLGANIDGGFNGKGDEQISNPDILTVLYASAIDKKLEEVIQVGGKIFKPI